MTRNAFLGNFEKLNKKNRRGAEGAEEEEESIKLEIDLPGFDGLPLLLAYLASTLREDACASIVVRFFTLYN